MRLIRLLLFLALSVPALAQPWSGVLAPARATDWTQAGVPGGIPSAGWANCTTPACNTFFSSPTAANCVAAVASAFNNTVVRVPAGSFTGNCYSNRGNVVLRGAGVQSTTWTCTGNCLFGGGSGTGGQGGYPGGLGSTNLTGTLTQGTTVLTVASTTGLSAGQTVVIDQLNAPYVNTTGVEGPCTSGNSCGRNDSPLGFSGSASRAEQEMVLITGVNPGANQITIAAPGLSHDLTPALIPQVFFWNSPKNIQYFGIENMKINAANNDRVAALAFCDFCWIKNVEIDNSARGGVFSLWSYRIEIRDSYINAANNGCGPTHYGIELLDTSFAKMENNILYEICDPFMTQGSYASVIGYDYMLRNVVDNEFSAMNNHLAQAHHELREGNVGGTSQWDFSWGGASQETMFRSYLTGHDPNATNYRIPTIIQSWNRFVNIVGNVLGDPTYHLNYQCTNTNVLGSDNYIYDLGFFNGCVNGSLTGYDIVTLTSLMRWGNWDSVTYCSNGGHTGSACGGTGTNGVRFCTGAGIGNPACTGIETAATDPTFPGLSNPSQTLAASFYTGATTHASCGTGLTFWKNPSSGFCPPYPPIGPDVTCTTNCNANTATHAAMIPAQLCYANGTKDGNGYLTAYDASNCYAIDSSGPIVQLAPTSLTFPSQVLGTSSTEQTVTLTNIGTTNMTVNAPSFTGDYSVGPSNTCGGGGGTILAPTQSCTLSTIFTPSGVGTRNGTMSVTDTAPGSPHSVPLTGTGVSVPVVFTPPSLSFSNIAVGSTSAAQVVILTNGSASTLTITSIVTTGDFANTTTCGGTLGAGLSCNISVTFTPTNPGPRSGLVTMIDSASGSPHTIPLDGVGLPVSGNAPVFISGNIKISGQWSPQ